VSTFGILRSLSNTFTSYADSGESNASWPFVTIPDFQYRSHDYLKISGAEMIAFSPLVSPLDVKEWASYSVNHQGWIEEGLRTSFDEDSTNHVSATPAPIREMVWKFNDGTSNPIPDSTPIPSLPLWQMYPPPTDTAVLNYNLRSNGHFDRGIALSESSKKTVLSQIFLDNELSVFDRTLDFEIPRSLVIQPVFESFENEAPVAGFLLVLVPWNIFFEAVLGEGTSPLICVMSNSCGSTFSYRVDGPKATFLGNDDVHDLKYETMKVQSLFPDFERDNYIGESIAKYCEYSLTIYPTTKFEEAYQNSSPFVNMSAVLAVFLLTSMLFLVYDWLVQRLKRKVVDQAQRSTAIVDR
jgi:hypothetical protein